MAYSEKKDEALKKSEDQRRIELERIEINTAYDQGGGTDLITENKDGTVRSLSDEFQDRTDRYGFIHDQKLPAALTENELKRNNIEKLREKKWILMLKDWKIYYTGRYSDKLAGRVFKGIPNSMRNPGWSKFLDIDSQIKAQTGVYEKMRNLARLYSVDLRQIDLDINRTFRNNLAYKKRYNQRQVQLYNILAAYSIYNTEIGYCQGMATVTALVLMYLSDEEKTFWALSQLMSNTKYSMHGFFKQDFPKLIRYVDKHDMIIKTFLPKIHKKFIKYNVTSLLYTTKWFLQCYLDALPFSLVLRVWDVYLLKGDIVILAMSYCILRLHKRRLLLKEFDMDKINDFLNHKLPDDFLYTDDEVMIKLEMCIEKIQKHRFPTGPIIENIPNIELPKIPFGDFKKIDKNEIISSISQKSGVQPRNSLDRSAAYELMAKERLEVEKKKQEEERKIRKQQSIENGLINNENPDLENILNKTGQPILNISDDDDDFEMSDSEDDLNPSKISEYDEDRPEKESMISNLTRHSEKNILDSKLKTQNGQNSGSLNSSYVSLEKESPNIQGDTTIVTSPTSPDSEDMSLVRQISEYENQKQSNIASSDYENLSNKPSPIHQNIKNISTQNKSTKPSIYQSPKKSFNFTNILPLSPQKKDEAFRKKLQSTENIINNGQNNRPTIPQSQSYIISPNYSSTASILSSPPPLSPSSYMTNRSQNINNNKDNSNITNSTSASQSSAHIASIITNPSYYNNTNSNNRINYEYVRSPHGIYTRINNSTSNCSSSNSGINSSDGKVQVKKSPSFRIISQNQPGTTQNIPQSTSSFIISNSSVLSKNNNSSSSGKVLATKNNSQSSIVVHPNLLSQQPPSSTTGIINAESSQVTKQNSTNKRTSSLRSIQNKFQNHFLINSTSTSKISSNSIIQKGPVIVDNAVNTPTKLNLQNHSLRIANIQQKQYAHLNSYSTISSSKNVENSKNNNKISNTNYPTISIISQGPTKSSFSNIPNGYQPAMSKNKNEVKKRVENEDLIEQYDYL